MRPRRPARTAWLIAAAVLLGSAALPSPQLAVTSSSDSACKPSPRSADLARGLIDNRYSFVEHPTVELPAELTWTEDPFGSRNWRYQLHSLLWLVPLLEEGIVSGVEAYRTRAVSLLQSWITSNPPEQPAADFAWNDHSTALRAIALSCVARRIGLQPWLRASLIVHGETLADPNFYVERRNHALNQNLGLLEIGCLLNRPDFSWLASNRINELVPRSVDLLGVTDEQSVSYQAYNFGRYRLVEERLRTCGRRLPLDLSERIDRMATFLAHATQPDGRYTMLGDGDDQAATPIAGSEAEFAATLGRRGPRPSSSLASYRDKGFVFGRTGWGDRRPIEDEIAFSLRFGPRRYSHGHHDATSVTLYGFGSRLLLDSGSFGYEPGPWRDYFVSPEAHNLVVIDGVPVTADTSHPLLRETITPTLYEAVVQSTAFPGVSVKRRVLFARNIGYLIVEDTIDSAEPQTVRQLWHLREGSQPLTSGSGTWTRRDRGNVLIQQLRLVGTTRIVSGETSPIQGWLSYRYLGRLAAPVVAQEVRARSARFLTLIVPFESGVPPVRVHDLSITSDGFQLVVQVGDQTERVTATATGATLTTLPFRGVGRSSDSDRRIPL